MGVLFWQLNDLWPGASWSAVEHGGRWKALMYTVKRAFAPVALAVTYDAGGRRLALDVVNDGPRAVDVTGVALRLGRWDDPDPATGPRGLWRAPRKPVLGSNCLISAGRAVTSGGEDVSRWR
jgi:beta-mannosidase